ncbi:hypothetical protein WBG78_30395 [Chryseolinea sp. T2]|uniref:hypothetical protein n=1 Tax=Chryseolinea sp. T2 TaxID=3129255 RepID=UPI0030769766
MKKFILPPDAAKGLHKILLTRLLSLAGVVIMVLFVLPRILSGDASFDLSTGLTLLITGFALTISYYFSLQRMKQSLSSYQLTIADDSITREMSIVPPITIAIKDIQSITRNNDGSITITGKSALNAIGIPASVERKEELQMLLAEIMPLTDKSNNSVWLKYQYFIVLLIVGFLYGSYMIRDKYISSAMGILFIGLMVYSWVVMQRSNNVSKRIKLSSYLMILPMYSVIMRLIALWA